MAMRAVVKEEAGVGRHCFRAAMAARRACDYRLEQGLRSGARSTAKPIPHAGRDESEEAGVEQIDSPGVMEYVNQR